MPPMGQPYQPGMNMHPMQAQNPTQAMGADFTAWGLDGATAQLGMQLGHSAVAAGQDYVQRNVSESGALRARSS